MAIDTDAELGSAGRRRPTARRSFLRQAAQAVHHLLPRVLAMLAVLAMAAASAAPAPPPVRAEVETLLRALQTSGCQFNRNGSWFTGEEAQAHLAKKLEYLEGKGLIRTSEDFIRLGASTSSVSGKPYLVRCGSAPPVESKVWLHEQLKAQRQAK